MLMGKIFLKLLGRVREVAEAESLETDIKEGENLESVLHCLSEKFGERLQNLLFSKNGSWGQNLVVFVNGKNVLTEGGLKTALNDGDQLIIFTPIVGG
jgi:MoaD family protein